VVTVAVADTVAMMLWKEALEKESTESWMQFHLVVEMAVQTTRREVMVSELMDESELMKTEVAEVQTV